MDKFNSILGKHWLDSQVDWLQGKKKNQGSRSGV